MTEPRAVPPPERRPRRLFPADQEVEQYPPREYGVWIGPKGERAEHLPPEVLAEVVMLTPEEVEYEDALAAGEALIGLVYTREEEEPGWLHSIRLTLDAPADCDLHFPLL